MSKEGAGNSSEETEGSRGERREEGGTELEDTEQREEVILEEGREEGGGVGLRRVGRGTLYIQ